MEKYYYKPCYKKEWKEIDWIFWFYYEWEVVKYKFIKKQGEDYVLENDMWNIEILPMRNWFSSSEWESISESLFKSKSKAEEALNKSIAITNWNFIISNIRKYMWQEIKEITRSIESKFNTCTKENLNSLKELNQELRIMLN